MQKVRDILPETHKHKDLGTGTQFLMLVGAPEPWTFLSPSMMDEQAALTGQARKILDLREGVRPCILMTFARIDGPAIKNGKFRIGDLKNEFDVWAWYVQYRLPHMAQMKGCIAARVMVSVTGWAKYSVLYEFTSLQARMDSFDLPHEALALDEEEWTVRVIRYTQHTPGSPTVGERIWPQHRQN